MSLLERCKRLPAALKPKPVLSEREVERGLKWWTREGTAALGFWSITTSGFLAGYALAVGCNNLQIGILASLPLITQPMQLLFIPLVERVRWRKAISLFTWVPAQLLWLPMALIPFFLDVPSPEAVALLLAIMAVRGVFVAALTCAWNSWIRDLVPQTVLGSAFAKRQARASLAGLAFGLAAALFVDFWRGETSGETEVLGYTYALLFGIVFLGMASPIFMMKMPEPLMDSPPGSRPSIWSTIVTPFQDSNFRHLLAFLFMWGLALNLAIPFFAVYMLQRLDLPLSAVIGFSVLSQVFNIWFLQVWGGLADRFGIKVILSLSASLYLLVILGWTFTTLPEKYWLTIPLLVILHMLAGIASAGVTLGTGTIGMKLAPQGQATSYLAVAAIALSLGAGLGPLFGGYFADYFSDRTLSLNWTWQDPTHAVDLPALHLTGFDFLFGIAFLVGALTLNILLALREEGEVGRDVVLQELFSPGRQFSRPMSTVPGLNFLGQFPYGYLRRLPIPGLDVAVGVTAYQIAQTAKAATVAAIQSGHTTRKMTRALQDNLAEFGKTSADQSPAHRFEITRQAMRGSIHALDEIAGDIGELSRWVSRGLIRTMRWGQTDVRDVFKGIGYGAVQGASEVGADPGEAAREVIETAKRMAHQSGISEEEAIAETARGAREAAEAIGPEAIARVEFSMPQEASKEDVAQDDQGRV